MKKLTWLVAMLMVFWLVSIGNATLIKKDFVPSSGDRWLTLDTETNLEWLNPMVTYMTDAIDIQYFNYGNWYGNGFRAATLEEVNTLIKNYLGDTPSDWTVQRAWEFIGIMGGPTYHNPNPSFPEEYYLIGPTEIFNIDLEHHWWGAQALQAGIVVDSARNIVMNMGSSIYSGHPLTNDMSGNWLVRTVPEPATMLLLGLGLLGVAGARRRLEGKK